MSQQTDYDIVIVGGGMVGCLLAYALLKLSPTLKIALIDENAQQTPKGQHPGFDARSIALNAGSCDILEQLGLWTLLQKNAEAIVDIHISDRGHCGVLELPKRAHSQPFGYVVELQDVGGVIDKQLGQYKQLTRLYTTRIKTIEKQLEQVVCYLDNGKTIRAKLCVAADGGNSLTRELLAIPALHSDYGCSAIIANLSCTTPHQNRAFERFTESGPIALLPLSGNRYSMVWSVENSAVEKLAALDSQQFLVEFQQAFGYRAGIFNLVGKRDTYPLKLLKTDNPVTHRGVCIGNAAHSLHPVMGQGFNLGLRDLYVLAVLISQAENSQEIGSFKMLNQYWCSRQADHHRTISLTDWMVHIFSSNSWPVSFSRNIALQAMRCLPSLSSPIVQQAKGQFNLFPEKSGN